MEWLAMERWSPYVIGISIGVLSWIAFLLSDKPLGTSTAYARTSGMIGRLFCRSRIEHNAYFQQFQPQIEWQWMLVFGIIIGACLSSLCSGTFALQWIPTRWVDAFGENTAIRILVAFAGGSLIGIGARWANGCTSGHGISGVLQLAVSSWIAVTCFFIGGIATAMILFHVI